MRIVVLDLETRLLAKDLADDKDLAWARVLAGDGGISALVIYDYGADWPYVYDDHSIRSAVEHVESADVVVGYRSEGFDIRVIEGVAGRNIRVREHIDLYKMIAQANAHRGISGTKGDFTLDAVCRRCFGKGKNGEGTKVPELIRQGRWADIFKYCMNDVKLTKQLFEYVCQHGGVPNITGSFLKLDIPEWIKRGIDVRN